MAERIRAGWELLWLLPGVIGQAGGPGSGDSLENSSWLVTQRGCKQPLFHLGQEFVGV